MFTNLLRYLTQITEVYLLPKNGFPCFLFLPFAPCHPSLILPTILKPFPGLSSVLSGAVSAAPGVVWNTS